MNFIEAAKKAGWPDMVLSMTKGTEDEKRLERFAALVLEEAAKVCDSVNNYSNPMTANDCADEIRALKGAKE